MLLSVKEMDPSSRTWVFQAGTTLSADQCNQIRSDIHDYLKQWTSHNHTLYTYGDVVENRFIVVMVDDRYEVASGCSIDAMTRFIKSLEKKYGIDFLDRMQVAYVDDASSVINTVHINQLADAINCNKISEDTIVFNNIIKTKQEFDTGWKVKLRDSWHKRFI